MKIPKLLCLIAALAAGAAALYFYGSAAPKNQANALSPSAAPPSACPARGACPLASDAAPLPPQNAESAAMDRQFGESVPQFKEAYYDKITEDTVVDDFRKCSNYGLELTPTVSWLRPVSLTGADIMAKLFFDADKVFGDQKTVLEPDLQKFCMLETAKNIDRVLLDQFYADAGIAAAPADFKTRVEPIDEATVAILVDTGAAAPVRVIADAGYTPIQRRTLYDACKDPCCTAPIPQPKPRAGLPVLASDLDSSLASA
jgi:hypothetical protein